MKQCSEISEHFVELWGFEPQALHAMEVRYKLPL